MLTGLLKTFCWKAININIFPTGTAGKTFICKWWSLISIFVQAIGKPPRVKQTWWKWNLYLQSDLTEAYLLSDNQNLAFLTLAVSRAVLRAKNCTVYPSYVKSESSVTTLGLNHRAHGSAKDFTCLTLPVQLAPLNCWQSVQLTPCMRCQYHNESSHSCRHMNTQ